MALEEILALITGGLQGESKRRADNASRQRYQQEQAFKQWQVMSDLDNKRAQVEQMKAYHDGMLRLGETKATNQNDYWDMLAQQRPLDRQSRMEIAGLNAGARLLPYAQTPGAFDVAGKFMGLPGGSAGPGDFVAPSVINNRNTVNQRDESQALQRIADTTDTFTARQLWEAENLRRRARGQEPLPPGFAQPNARSASAMGNMRANEIRAENDSTRTGLLVDRNPSIIRKDNALAGWYTGQTSTIPGKIANTEADTALKKKQGLYITAQTGNIDFDNRMAGLKLNLEALDQRWKTNPDNPQNIKAYLEFATAQRIAAREQRLALQGLVPRDYNRQAIPRKNWTPELDAQYTQMEIMARNLDGLADQAEKQLKNYMARNGMAPDGSPLVDPASNRAERTAPPKKYDANTFPPAPGYRPVPGSLPKPGAVGPQARAAGAKAGFKPQPIIKSDAAKRAGVGVKTRKPAAKNDVLDAVKTMNKNLKNF